jgi:hypothetical protein
MGCYGNDLGGLTPAPTEWGTRPRGVRNPIDRTRADTAASAVMMGTASHALRQEHPA